MINISLNVMGLFDILCFGLKYLYHQKIQHVLKNYIRERKIERERTRKRKRKRRDTCRINLAIHIELHNTLDALAWKVDSTGII